MSEALGVDARWVYLAIALLVFIVIVIAVTLKRRVKLGFGDAVVEVGEEHDHVVAEPQPAEAAKGVSIANQSKISGSKVNIQVGDSVSYHSPEAGQKIRHK